MSGMKRGHLTRTDRRGLLLVAVAFVVLALLLWHRGGTHDGQALAPMTAADSAEMARFAAEVEADKARRAAERQGAGRTDSATALRPFDPNTADSATMVSLGMRPWQAHNAMQYRRAGGRWRQPDDFARLYGAELMAVDHWLNQIGVRGGQRRGLGLEFHQLREFRDGDTLRQIDWKATARKRTPIAREYQDERDQQILFLLDCGRRMRSQDGDLSHFDHALNASLLLAYVALRQGDAVGAMTFAGDDRRHLPPGKGSAQLGALLNTVYDLQTSQRPADFPEAVQAVLSRQRRRALVILVTNLRDEDDEELLGAVKRLGRQHRVLVASLREEVLDTLRHEPVARYEQALAYTGTIDYLNARNGLHEKLAAHGVPVLDARPSELGPELISRYLGWKRAGVL